MSDENMFTNGYALLIGVGQYKDEKLSVPATAQDAADVASILVDSNFCAYPQIHVEVLTNEHATGANILAKLAALKEQIQDVTNTTGIIFFSGHGWLEGDYYFLPYETETFKSDGKLQVKLNTALANKDFLEGVRQIQAERLVVIFNTCFAGAAGTPLSPEVEQTAQLTPIPLGLYDPLVKGSGRVIFSSSSSGEKSWIKYGATNSLFVTHLLNGLKGHNMHSASHTVGVLDLFMYLSESVPADAASIGVTQTPVFNAYSTTRNFPIALLLGGKGLSPQLALAQGVDTSGNLRFNIASIRKLLKEALFDQDLNDLCMDYFPDVYDRFSDGMGKQQKISILIEYCLRHDLFPTLLTEVNGVNEEKYKQYEKTLIVSPAQSKPGSSLAVGSPTAPRPVSRYDSLEEIFKRKNFEQKISDFINEVPKAQRRLRSICRSFERYISPGKCVAASTGVTRVCSPIEEFAQFFKQSVHLPNVVIPERYGLMNALFKSHDHLIIVEKLIEEFCNHYGDAFDQPRGSREEIRNQLISHVRLLDLALDEAKKLLVMLDG
jgi:hypothetical protein